MSSKRNLFLALAMTSIVLSVEAQLANDMLNSGSNIMGLMLDNLRERNLYGENEAPYDGSPYHNNEFLKGQLQKNNTVYVNLDLRYDIFNDLVEFKRGDRALIIDPDHQIKRVEIGEDRFVVKRYDFRGEAKWGFLLELDSGKASLYARKMVSYRRAVQAQALQAEGTPAKYVNLPDIFYFQVGDDQVTKVDNTKKMIQGFPDKQDELNAFAKKEKISRKKAEDLIKLFQYYNSL